MSEYNEQNQGTSVGTTLLVFLLGVAVGATVATLYAPAAGTETRAQLADKAGQLKDKASELSTQVASKASQWKEQVVEKAGELKDRVSTRMQSPDNSPINSIESGEAVHNGADTV